MHRDHARVGQWEHARHARPDELTDRGQSRDRRVEHQVAVAAGLNHGAQHGGEGILLSGVLVGDQHGLRLEQDAQ